MAERNRAELSLLDAAAAALDGLAHPSDAHVVWKIQLVGDVLLRADRAIFDLRAAQAQANRILGNRRFSIHDRSDRQLRIFQLVDDGDLRGAARRYLLAEMASARAGCISATAAVAANSDRAGGVAPADHHVGRVRARMPLGHSVSALDDMASRNFLSVAQREWLRPVSRDDNLST